MYFVIAKSNTYVPWGSSLKCNHVFEEIITYVPKRHGCISQRICFPSKNNVEPLVGYVPPRNCYVF